MNDKMCSNCYEGDLGECGCEDPEGFSTENILCPYCGHENSPDNSDGLAYDESTEEYDCGECGQTFELEVFISYSWTTRRGAREEGK